MSTHNQTTRSSPSSNFPLNFDVAVNEYQRLTKQDLYHHPFTVALNVCTTPDDVLGLIRKQAEAFKPFREVKHTLMRWLNPIVEVLFMFPATLTCTRLCRLRLVREGGPVSFRPRLESCSCINLLPVSFNLKSGIHGHLSSSRSESLPIFCGAFFLTFSQAVKDVGKNYNTITDLFERVQFFLLRLRSYTGLPLTVGMTELLGKVMAQILLILALSTKAMKAGRISE